MVDAVQAMGWFHVLDCMASLYPSKQKKCMTGGSLLKIPVTPAESKEKVLKA